MESVKLLPDLGWQVSLDEGKIGERYLRLMSYVVSECCKFVLTPSVVLRHGWDHRTVTRNDAFPVLALKWFSMISNSCR